MQPKVLLMDEPFAHWMNTAHLQDSPMEIQTLGNTVVMITTMLTKRFCSRIAS